MRKITLTSLLFVAILYSCKKLGDRDSMFWVYNKSDKNVFFAVSRHYPDTSLPVIRMDLIEVEAGEKIPASFRQNELSEVFAELPADTLSVFIFSADTITKYSWDSIRVRYNILKRYDLSLDDVRSKQFPVTYQ